MKEDEKKCQKLFIYKKIKNNEKVPKEPSKK